jgi:hypothetical protein
MDPLLASCSNANLLPKFKNQTRDLEQEACQQKYESSEAVGTIFSQPVMG